ncbi:uncharacterized protein METZ01_LOCUS5964, partial [marine metagenome]
EPLIILQPILLTRMLMLMWLGELNRGKKCLSAGWRLLWTIS